MSDRYNDKKAYDLMVKARVALIMKRGWQGSFYAPLVMRLDFVESLDVPTMATDGKHLFYNPEYACNLSEDERIGVIVHEVNHCASLHHVRMGFRPIEQWNVACDYPTNENVLKAGFTLPNGLLVNPEFYGMSGEDVYNVLFPPIPPQKDEPEPENEPESSGDAGGNPESGDAGEPSQQDTGAGTGEGSDDESMSDTGEPGEGSGDGSGSGSGEPGSDGSGAGAPVPWNPLPEQLPANTQAGTGSGDPSDGQSPASVASGKPDAMGMGGVLPAYKEPLDEAGTKDASPEVWEQAVREAVSLAKAKGWGSDMPGSIREILGEIEAGKHDWKEQLRQFTDNRAAVKSSWKRPNRRFATANFVMPGTEKDGIDHALWLIDTSGSMDSHWLACIRGEIQEALDNGFIEKVTCVCIDTTVKAVFEYAQGDTIDFEPEGRGGTDFAPAFAWMAAQDESFSCAIYLTDLDCNSFGTEPDCPLLWAVYGRNWNRKVPFGEVIRLSE